MASTRAERSYDNVWGSFVAPHTGSGLPQGLNPHDTSSRVMQIQDMTTGKVTELALGGLTPDLVKAVGQELGPMPVAGAEEEQNAWTTTMLERVKSVAHPVGVDMTESQAASVVMSGSGVAAVQPHPVSARTQSQSLQPRILPRPAARQSVTSLSAAAKPAPVAEPSLPALPEVTVTFEIMNAATIPAAYEDVIVLMDQQLIVLVLDQTRHKRQFTPQPPAEGQTPPRTAMQIDGSQEIYEIAPSGIQFTYQQRAFVVLYIVDVASIGD